MLKNEMTVLIAAGKKTFKIELLEFLLETSAKNNKTVGLKAYPAAAEIYLIKSGELNFAE